MTIELTNAHIEEARKYMTGKTIQQLADTLIVAIEQHEAAMHNEAAARSAAIDAANIALTARRNLEVARNALILKTKGTL
jgi:hypothetical protein